MTYAYGRSLPHTSKYCGVQRLQSFKVAFLERVGSKSLKSEEVASSVYAYIRWMTPMKLHVGDLITIDCALLLP